MDTLTEMCYNVAVAVLCDSGENNFHSVLFDLQRC